MSELNVKDHGDSTRLKGEVTWYCEHDTTCGKWVGICDDLSLTVQADTQRELHSSIWEAMDELFKMLVEEGELKNFLVEHGWYLEQPESRSISDLPVNIEFSEGLLEGAAA